MDKTKSLAQVRRERRSVEEILGWCMARCFVEGILGWCMSEGILGCFVEGTLGWCMARCFVEGILGWCMAQYVGLRSGGVGTRAFEKICRPSPDLEARRNFSCLVSFNTETNYL